MYKGSLDRVGKITRGVITRETSISEKHRDECTDDNHLRLLERMRKSFNEGKMNVIWTSEEGRAERGSGKKEQQVQRYR
jgi:hypothetical protein